MKYAFIINFNKNINKNMINFKNKKAIMAMDALIGTILSVIALFFLLQLMYMFFFQNSDENFKIAQNDAQSIVDFVNTYSSDNKDNPYYSYNNCFYILKLQNLENYQIQKDAKKTYSYLITNKGVLIIDNDNVKKFEENYELTPNMIKKEYKFDKQLMLKKDLTESGLFAKINVFFIFDFGQNGKFRLSNVENDVNYIYLKQKENIVGADFDNNNILYAFIPEKGVINNAQNWLKDGIIGGYPKNFVLQNGSYLVYSKNYYGVDNTFFVPNTEISEIYVKDNLCSNKYINEKINDINQNKVENLLKIDYVSKKITFSCIPEGEEEINLVWEDGYYCDGKNSKCFDFISTINVNEYNSLFNSDNPNENKFSEFCKKNTNVPTKLKVSESTKEINKDKKIVFDILFQKDSLGFNGKKLEDLTDKEKEKYFFLESRSNWEIFRGYMPNNCDYSIYGDLCYEIYIKDNKVYSYVKEPINGEILKFYYFNENFLRKKKDSNGNVFIYFITNPNELIEYQTKEMDTFGTAFSKSKGFLQSLGAALGGGTDDKNIYVLKLKDIPVEGSYDKKEIIVYLTPRQFMNIREPNYESSDFINKATADKEISLQEVDPNLAK